MIFNEAVTTTTRTMIVPKVYDTVTNGTPGLMTFLQTAKDWKTGTKFEFPIKFQDTTNGGNTGVADKLDTDRQNVRVKASFEVKMATKPVVVADIETTLNAGDEQIVDLLDTEFDSQAQSLMNVMGQNLYAGNGAGNEWDSLANAADDGTNYATYGGLSRSTYSSWAGYYIASTGALTLAKLATAYDETTVGVDNPNMIFTTKALWSVYESLLTPTVQANYNTSGYPRMNAFGVAPNNAGHGGDNGFVYLSYRGTSLVKDEQVPAGKVFLTNTKNFGMKGVSIKAKNITVSNFKKTSDAVPSGVPGNVPSTKGFNFREMMSPVDQLAEVGHLIYAGNFISTNSRLQGQMTGVTA